MARIEDLSNMELAEELRNFGMSPGPIIASTRRVYEKKLIKLRLTQNASGEPVVEREPEHFYDEVPDDEDRSPPPKLRSPKLRRRPIRTEPREEDESFNEEMYSGLESPEAPSMGRPHTAKTSSSSQPQTPQQAEAGGLPMIVKILAFLFVIFLVYLVISNMEPSSGSNVPRSLPSDEA